MPVRSVGEGPCNAGAKKSHTGRPLCFATPWSHCIRSPLFRCANSGSARKPQTSSPRHSWAHRTGTLSGADTPSGTRQRSIRAARFRLTFVAFMVGDNMTKRIARQWCPVLGMRSTGCHARGLEGQICGLQAGRGLGRGAFVSRRRFWIAIEGIFRCATHASLQTHSASSAQQNAATPNQEEKQNDKPKQQEKNN